MPDTSRYFVAAYVAAAVIYSLYTLSLWRRARDVRRRLAARRASR